MKIRCCKLDHEWGVNSVSVIESWCQSTSVSANGGLSRGNGSAVGSGFVFHVDWKTEGNDDLSGTGIDFIVL